jgi:hypothetical protein
LASISTSAAAGSGAGQLNGVATGSLASLLIAAATGQGASSSVATGLLQALGIVAAIGSALEGVQDTAGALAGNRPSADTTRPAQLGTGIRQDRAGATRATSNNTSRPTRVANTAR